MTANNISNMLPLSILLTTCYRMKSDRDFWSCLGFRRLTKRLTHCFAQEAELALETACTDTCPDPTLLQKYHPYMSGSRRKGNKALRMNMVNRFLCRGAGYVTLKDEKNLGQLGVVKEKSTLAARTASEYTARLLIKVEQTVSAVVGKQPMQCLNFCFDAATFAGEQAGAIQGFRLRLCLAVPRFMWGSLGSGRDCK